MRPTKTATVASVTTSAVIPVDHKQNPFSVSFGVVVTGTLTFKVQHTFDEVMKAGVTPTWFDHATVTGKTASTDGNYAYPITAIRLNVTAYTSGGATMTVIQGTSQ